MRCSGATGAAPMTPTSSTCTLKSATTRRVSACPDSAYAESCLSHASCTRFRTPKAPTLCFLLSGAHLSSDVDAMARKAGRTPWWLFLGSIFTLGGPTGISCPFCEGHLSTVRSSFVGPSGGTGCLGEMMHGAQAIVERESNSQQGFDSCKSA